MDRPIETLSKGFRRRVGLAQAILHDPEVLILDEPTDGLDPNQKHAVRELIRGIAARKTIVISTHMLEEVRSHVQPRRHHQPRQAGGGRHPGELAARAPGGKLDDLFRALTSSGRGRGMSALAAVFRREFAAYFATPIAFVFLIIFLFSMGVFTFYVGNFYDNGVADLSVFFGYPALAVSVSDSRPGDAAMGGGKAQRQHRTCCSPCPCRSGPRCWANFSPPGCLPGWRWR